MMHFSQFYFGSDAAQPPEIGTNFVDFDEICPGKEVSLFGVKNEDSKKSLLKEHREALCHHGFMYTRLYSQILGMPRFSWVT